MTPRASCCSRLGQPWPPPRPRPISSARKPPTPPRRPAAPALPVAPALPADTTRDTVTGLLTHRAFQERLQTETERTARYGGALSLVLLDLDGFGAYNQAHGFPAGDDALLAVAQMLLSKVRSMDIVARFGADEFAVLLPETNRAGALIAAERFRSGVVGLPGDRAPLTASLSLATLAPDMSHPAALINQAKDALRLARTGGPGQIAQSDDADREVAATLSPKPRTRKAA